MTDQPYTFRDEDAPTPELRERYRVLLERLRAAYARQLDLDEMNRFLLLWTREMLEVKREDLTRSTDPHRRAHLLADISENVKKYASYVDMLRETTPAPSPATRKAARAKPAKPPLPLFVVMAGRGQTRHLMRSRTDSTPDPMSPGSIAAQLLWFGGNAKLTLCGRQATRSVADVFQPHEASCQECLRRAGIR
jgi:hypothetical protein